MSESLPKLEILRVLTSEAKRLIDARDRCLTIHRTEDIDTAGDEVEMAVRNVIQEKLPVMYHVGHGHIVDANLKTSPQLDVVVSDNGEPVLFTTENGSQYFPFESVYAIGEIKSTYSKSKKQIEHFVETIRNVKQDLTREKTPPNYAGNGLTLGTGFSSSETRPYRNPLFSFMLFVSGGDFKEEDIKELLAQTDPLFLPNILCILDKGIVVNAQPEETRPGIFSLNLSPELNGELGNQHARWYFFPVGSEQNRPASTLGFLWMALIQQLSMCTLTKPNMIQYLIQLFAFENGRVLG